MEVEGEDPTLPEGWIKCLSKSLKGKIYYFNTLTGESLWEHPEAILLEDQEKDKKLEKPATPANAKSDDSPLQQKTSNQANEKTQLSRKRGHKEETIKPLAKIIRNIKGTTNKHTKNGTKIEKHNPNKKGVKLTEKAINKVVEKSAPKNLSMPKIASLPRSSSASKSASVPKGAQSNAVKLKRLSSANVNVEKITKDSLKNSVPIKTEDRIKAAIPRSSESNVRKSASVTVKARSYLEHREDISSNGINDSNTQVIKMTNQSKERNRIGKVSNKPLYPLKPLRRSVSKESVDKMDRPLTKPLDSNYKIPKRPYNVTPKTPSFQAQIPNFGEIAVKTENNEPRNGVRRFSLSSDTSETLLITQENSSRTVRSVDGMSERSSPAWSMSDVVMAGTQDSESVSEYHEPESFEAEEMEIDDAEFMSRKIFKQIEDIRCERIEVPKEFEDHIEAITQEGLQIQEGSLFIVLDTNILLSHLKFISELKDSPIPGTVKFNWKADNFQGFNTYRSFLNKKQAFFRPEQVSYKMGHYFENHGAGRPTIIIPWMVVQELDRLKTAPDSRVHEFAEGEGQQAVGVNVLARKAVSFLHSCFAQNHPRIKGQTVMEASQSVEGFVEESNDDSILLCSLKVQEKATDAKTVLLSNDRNLCNKAMMNGVKAFTKKTLLSGLRDLFQSGNIIVHKDHFKAYFKEAEAQEILADRRRKADDLICELQCVIREAFAAVIEKEMKEAYDDLWLEIVRIKPPWTLLDTFDLLEKHWIAVFGQVIRRNLKERVLELKQKFSSGDAVLRNLDLAGEMIDLGYLLCEAFSKHSDYDGVLPKCLAAVIVLQRTHKEFMKTVIPVQGENLEHHGPLMPLRPLPQPRMRRDSDIPECISSVLHEDRSTEEIAVNGEQSDDVKPPHFIVMSTFDDIWKAVTVLSSSIFDSLDYPNPFRSENDQINLKPSSVEAMRFLEQFIPCLGRLVQAIQGVLACPLESTMENSAIFTELGQSIAQFMKVMMCQDCKITFDALRAFCIDNLSRTALIQGLSQLDRALAMLQHCSSFGIKRS